MSKQMEAQLRQAKTARAALQDEVVRLKRELKEAQAKNGRLAELMKMWKAAGTPAAWQIRNAALSEAAAICDQESAEWDSDAVQADKNYAAHAGGRIRAMLDAAPEPIENQRIKRGCQCKSCKLERGFAIIDGAYLCPNCGDKRCQKVIFHGYECDAAPVPPCASPVIDNEGCESEGAGSDRQSLDELEELREDAMRYRHLVNSGRYEPGIVGWQVKSRSRPGQNVTKKELDEVIDSEMESGGRS